MSIPVEPATWSLLLQQLLDRQSLSQHQSTMLMQGWLRGEIPPALSGAILAAIEAKQITAPETGGDGTSTASSRDRVSISSH